MTPPDYYIGIHAGHDANVTVIDDKGQVLFAAGEERFNRKKMFAGYPARALKHAAGLNAVPPSAMATCRMNRTAKTIRELGFFYHSFRRNLAAPRFGIWVKNSLKKLRRGRILEQMSGAEFPLPQVPVTNVEHHHAHAASAYYPSGFESAYVMTLDGEGDGYSCCFYETRFGELHRFNAYYHNDVTVGRDYEKVTAMLGFHPLRHPGKITGLAAYGHHNDACITALDSYLKQSWRSGKLSFLDTSQAYQVISEEGKRQLIQDRQTVLKAFSREDIAFAIQYLTEQKVLALIKANIKEIDGADIALAGGVFANVALNKRVKELGFRQVFVQPAMTDAGLSLGAVLYAIPNRKSFRPIEHVYWGPSYSPDDIKLTLDAAGVKYTMPDDMGEAAAELLCQGKVLARFDGAMEFGPRALGNRSILYHAGDPSVNDWLNKKLQRTEFMPFAPVTLMDHAQANYLNITGAEHTAKFMTITFDCSEKMKQTCPAVVHVDGTARPQLLDPADNPGYGAILQAYYKKTGIPSLVNTSFNMHEEPIVMTPDDALRAYKASELDALIAGPFLICG